MKCGNPVTVNYLWSPIPNMECENLVMGSLHVQDVCVLKIGNTREQQFLAWQSFHFDKNTETIDAYVTCIRQVATSLGYGEPQILEVFKKHLLQNYIGYYSL